MVVAITLALACGKSDNDSGASKGKPISAVIELEAGAVTPAATLTIELPGGWHAHEVFDATWLPGKDAFEVSLNARTGCGGECAADKIVENISAEVEADLLEKWTQSGAAHMKPTVESIENGTLPLGRYRAYRLSYPPAPKGKAQGRSGTHLECYLSKPGEPFLVEIEATASPKQESQIWPALLDSCKGASITATKP